MPPDIISIAVYHFDNSDNKIITPSGFQPVTLAIDPIPNEDPYKREADTEGNIISFEIPKKIGNRLTGITIDEPFSVDIELEHSITTAVVIGPQKGFIYTYDATNKLLSIQGTSEALITGSTWEIVLNNSDGERRLDLVHNVIPRPPVIDSVPRQDIYLGGTVNINVDLQNSPTKVGTTSLLTGLFAQGSPQRLRVFGTANDEADFTVDTGFFDVTAENESGSDQEQVNFNLRTDGVAPDLGAISSPILFTNNSRGTRNITATGTPRPTVTADRLPNDISIVYVSGNTYRMQGTSDTNTDFETTIRATNPLGEDIQENIRIVVGSRPVISNIPALNGKEDESFSGYQVTASGYPDPTFTASGLPSGISISSSGSITGFFNNDIDASPIITATNIFGSHSRSFAFRVESAADPPGPPRSLTATAGAANRRVDLSWLAPFNNGGAPIIRYEYSYGEVPGFYGPWTSTGSTSTSFSLFNLTNGQEYAFLVRAVNSEGGGTQSDHDNAIPLGWTSTSYFFTAPDPGTSSTGRQYILNVGSLVTGEDTNYTTAGLGYKNGLDVISVNYNSGTSGLRGEASLHFSVLSTGQCLFGFFGAGFVSLDGYWIEATIRAYNYSGTADTRIRVTWR